MWWRRVVNNWQQRNTRATDSSCEHPLRTRLRSYSIASAGDDDISQFPPVPTSSVSRSPIGLVAVYATIIGIIVGAFIAGVAQLILFTERLVYGSDHQHEISTLDSLGPLSICSFTSWPSDSSPGWGGPCCIGDPPGASLSPRPCRAPRCPSAPRSLAHYYRSSACLQAFPSAASRLLVRSGHSSPPRSLGCGR